MRPENDTETQKKETPGEMPLNKRLIVPTFGEMIKTFSTVRREWKLKTPFQKWCYLYGFGKAPFSLIRLPMFQETQALHLLSYYGYVYTAIYLLLVLYTVYYCVIGEEFVKCLSYTCMLSVALAVSFRNFHKQDVK